MITYWGMSEVYCYDKLKYLGLSEEHFYALPYECQRAILMAGLDIEEKKKREMFQKKIALKQYEFEDKTKEKILKLIKKNK